jgi:hypothetical protein
MIGTAHGVMVSTTELQEYVAEDANTFVYVDRALYEVVQVTFYSNGVAKVTLAPQFGSDWVLEVAKEDYDEPMWEVEGQS